MARRKKIALLKQKKNKHAKVKSSHARADVVESLSDGKDDATPKLKKKRKKSCVFHTGHASMMYTHVVPCGVTTFRYAASGLHTKQESYRSINW